MSRKRSRNICRFGRIELATSTGPRGVRARLSDQFPGLAITLSTARDLDPLSAAHYAITHAPSGRVIVDEVTLGNAKRIAIDLAPVLDWCASADRIPAAAFAIVERIVQWHSPNAFNGLAPLHSSTRSPTVAIVDR